MLRLFRGVRNLPVYSLVSSLSTPAVDLSLDFLDGDSKGEVAS